jgi:hypothetical protein
MFFATGQTAKVGQWFRLAEGAFDYFYGQA